MTIDYRQGMQRAALLGSIIVAALVTTGCGKKDNAAAPDPTVAAANTPASATANPPANAPAPADGPPTAAECDALGQRTIAGSMQQTPPGAPPEQVRQLQAMSDEAAAVIATHCKNDGWSRDAVTCGLTAADPGVACKGKLSADQVQRMTQDVQAVFTRGAAQVMEAARKADEAARAAGTAIPPTPPTPPTPTPTPPPPPPPPPP